MVEEKIQPGIDRKTEKWRAPGDVRGLQWRYIFETEQNEMDYQIITDSCCDYTYGQYNDLDVTAVPLSVMWDGISHSHFSTEEALKDFYNRMRGVLGLFHLGMQR